MVRAMAEVKQALDSTESTRKIMGMAAGSKGSYHFVLAGTGEPLTCSQHARSALVVQKVVEYQTMPEFTECCRRDE